MLGVSLDEWRNSLAGARQIAIRRIAILLLAMGLLCARGPGLGSGSRVVIFDPDPDHIWNRTYSCLFIRADHDGNEYGSDTLDPLLWPQTRYLLAGESRQRAVACLDSFLRTHAERLVQDPGRRAILQHDLWAAFDWAAAGQDDDFQPQRLELEKRLAEAIQRLALTGEQLRKLPDTYEAAATARKYASEYDPHHKEQPFLPLDLFRPDGPWVCLSAYANQPTATVHFTGRSRFLVFLRLPERREATLSYISKLRFYEPLIRSESGADFLNLKLPQFPAGTEVALVRQAIAINNLGQLTPTRLTESVQLRVYHAITPGTKYTNYINGPSSADQDFFEFRMSREQLVMGHNGGLTAVAPDEKEFPTFNTHGFDPFDESSPQKEEGVVLKRCPACHSDSGIHSVQSRVQWMRRLSRNDEPTTDTKDALLWETHVTASYKEQQPEFKLLQRLWTR